RRPPRSSPFPYTTLFRSLLHHVSQLAGEHEPAFAAVLHRGGLDEQHVPAGSGDREAGRHARRGGARRGLLEELLSPERVAHGLEDRKSTRLNSSHRTISY